jgi:hypothetical protein
VRISFTTTPTAARDIFLVLDLHRAMCASAFFNSIFSAAWNGCFDPGIAASKITIRRRSSTLGTRDVPPSTTIAAHPECTRNPTATRRRSVSLFPLFSIFYFPFSDS